MQSQINILIKKVPKSIRPVVDGLIIAVDKANKVVAGNANKSLEARYKEVLKNVAKLECMRLHDDISRRVKVTDSDKICISFEERSTTCDACNYWEKVVIITFSNFK